MNRGVPPGRIMSLFNGSDDKQHPTLDRRVSSKYTGNLTDFFCVLDFNALLR